MKSMLHAAAVFSVISVCLAGVVAAQQPPGGSQAGVLIAVIDINYVFDKHPGFQQRMEQVKATVTAFEAEVNAERTKITQMGEKLRELQPGSPDYKRLEEDIARQMSNLQVRTQLKRKDVLEQEAQCYYDGYTELQQVVSSIASRYGIGLVLRYDREEIDPTDRASVLRGLNRAVVLQRNLDVSDLVLQQLAPAQVGDNSSAGGRR